MIDAEIDTIEDIISITKSDLELIEGFKIK